mmetsp:Transcript_10609/g.14450  ORF Transcript_10609/g.14450 Transcript_10609/m.14450 type:complete len:265 (-) Transcript_10609:669-1463(-)
MHPACVATHLFVHVKESPQLCSDQVEWARLVPGRGLDSVAVHGVTLPHHHLAFLLHGRDQLGEVLAQLLRSHAHNDHDLAGDVVGVDCIDELNQLCRVALVRDLDSNGVVNATHKLHVCAVQLACALAHPKQVRRAPVVLICGGVQPSQSLFVVQQQGFVRSEKLSGLRDFMVLIDAAGAHEKHSFVKLVCESLVLFALLRVGGEVQAPFSHSLQRGIPAHSESPQQVQGCRALVVGADQPGGIRHTTLFGELVAVDVVTTVGG